MDKGGQVWYYDTGSFPISHPLGPLSRDGGSFLLLCGSIANLAVCRFQRRGHEVKGARAGTAHTRKKPGAADGGAGFMLPKKSAALAPPWGAADPPGGHGSRVPSVRAAPPPLVK